MTYSIAEEDDYPMISVPDRLPDRNGFTAIELLISVTVSALIVVGCLAFMGYMIRVSADHRDKTVATLQVQYVSFWVSEDAVQAENINLGDTNGFPLTLNWQEWGDDQANITVTYSAEYMDGDSGDWQLKREHWVGNESLGAAVIGQYLVPDYTECHMNCYRTTYANVTALELNVYAEVFRGSANGTYEIHPRAFPEWNVACEPEQ